MTAGETTTRSREAQEFLDGVASALVDLPEDDRTDLLDELAAHLDELEAESDMPLVARLGSPQGYAAELRASAGLPPAGAARGNLADGLARVQQLRRRADIAAVERFLVTLRPFWWVLRAWVCVAMLTWFAQPHWSREIAFVPDLGHIVLSVAVLVAAVVLSVQIGRRGRLRTATARRLLAALNLAVLVSLWPVVLTVNEAVMYGTSGYYYGEQVRTVRAVPPHRCVRRRRPCPEHLRLRHAGPDAARRAALRPVRPSHRPRHRRRPGPASHLRGVRAPGRQRVPLPVRRAGHRRGGRRERRSGDRRPAAGVRCPAGLAVPVGNAFQHSSTTPVDAARRRAPRSADSLSRWRRSATTRDLTTGSSQAPEAASSRRRLSRHRGTATAADHRQSATSASPEKRTPIRVVDSARRTE